MKPSVNNVVIPMVSLGTQSLDFSAGLQLIMLLFCHNATVANERKEWWKALMNTIQQG
jgi:hypothetical protein